MNQIEAFYDVKNVRFEGMDLFETPGAEVMRRLEEANGQALEDVGVVLFDKIGITTGRLDENVREEYSVTAFARGTWEGKMEDFKPISFIG
ncbi:hypothetical protein NGM99_18330 [Mesorhizobium sp. RP14(2022)]|uniref:Glutamine synthetase n=1 Tax=Mesorhizobium liriopis TaxID=2953882 RepID=A0ABT1CAA0_9HYPH|nr:hypothetical protein [Mesorhizobium liriopis]MCO6051746.1 hypothetical protein [Mesorhizobium liriopis]